METAFKKNAAKVKTIIAETNEKSRELIRDIIKSNSQNLSSAVNSNQLMIDMIRKQFPGGGEKSTRIMEVMNNTFGKSMELSEGAIDKIIDSFSAQLKGISEFSTQFIDKLGGNGINSTGNAGLESVLDLIHKNFVNTTSVMTNSMKSTIESYNKYANLALNFKDEVGDSLITQLEAIHKMQTGQMNSLENWASEWWKHNGKEVAV